MWEGGQGACVMSFFPQKSFRHTPPHHLPGEDGASCVVSDPRPRALGLSRGGGHSPSVASSAKARACPRSLFPPREERGQPVTAHTQPRVASHSHFTGEETEPEKLRRLARTRGREGAAPKPLTSCFSLHTRSQGPCSYKMLPLTSMLHLSHLSLFSFLVSFSFVLFYSFCSFFCFSH